MARSIAFMKFKSTIELEIRAFWHLQSSLALSDRVVQGYTSNFITEEPHNTGYPFKAMHITPAAYLDESPTISGYVRENSLVSFITTFESYLFELTERIIYLEPDLISDSEMNMTAADIVAAAKSDDSRRWIALKVADKYLRNKPHTAMIKKLDKLSKAGTSISRKVFIEEWHKWTLVRNSIVHTTSQVTQELSDSWKEKFPVAGVPFNLTNQDISKVFTIAIELAQAIDAMAVKQIIKKSDALILAREIFVHYGISAPGELRKMINDAGIQVKLTNEDLTGMLSRHEKGAGIDSLALTFTDSTLARKMIRWSRRGRAATCLNLSAKKWLSLADIVRRLSTQCSQYPHRDERFVSSGSYRPILFAIDRDCRQSENLLELGYRRMVMHLFSKPAFL